MRNSSFSEADEFGDAKVSLVASNVKWQFLLGVDRPVPDFTVERPTHASLSKIEMVMALFGQGWTISVGPGLDSFKAGSRTREFPKQCLGRSSACCFGVVEHP